MQQCIDVAGIQIEIDAGLIQPLYFPGDLGQVIIIKELPF